MTKTLIDIPDELLAEARSAIGEGTTKADAVRTALTELVRRHRQAQVLDWIVEADPLADLRNSEVRDSARR
jgi:Arc/MetJ family transcription regulator